MRKAMQQEGKYSVKGTYSKEGKYTRGLNTLVETYTERETSFAEEILGMGKNIHPEEKCRERRKMLSRDKTLGMICKGKTVLYKRNYS